MFCLLASLTPFISQPVVNLHVEANQNSAVGSQAIYGMHIEIEKESGNYLYVLTEDQDQGWIKETDITWYEETYPSKVARVDSLKAHIYFENDVTKRAPMMSLPYGSKVEWIQETDTRWIQVKLLDGQIYWMQRNDLDREAGLKDLEEMIVFSHRFIERPYTWGGYSSEGLDCSGLTKLCFKERGITLPHSSRRQSEMGSLVLLEDIQRGDLLFFGEGKVAHVGIYLGNNTFIHACTREPLRPAVRIEELTETWKTLFLKARRINS